MLGYITKEIGTFKRNHILSFGLSLTGSALSIISNIYGTTLFLSIYPTQWLAYFLTSNSLATVFFSFIFASLLAKNAQRNTSIFLLIGILLLTLFIFLRFIPFFWLPFIIAVMTTTFGSIFSMTTWSIVPLAFGMREFKRILAFVVQSWSLGVILGSFLVPLILHIFPLDSLLYVIIFCSVISFAIIHGLVLQPQVVEKKQFHAERSPLGYPLFRTLVYFSVINVFLWALVDYVFKFESALHFVEDRDLADFFGYYLGIVNGLAFLVGLLTTRFLLRKFHISGLLYSTQILVFLGCLLVLFASSMLSPLWTIALLQALKPIIYYNYAGVAIDIILNVLPSSLRISGKFYMRSIVIPCSIILTYFVLLFVSQEVSPLLIVWIALCFILVLFYFSYRTLKQYRNTLREEIEFRRFTVMDEVKLGAFHYGGMEWSNKKAISSLHTVEEEEIEETFVSATLPKDRLEETIFARRTHYYVCKHGANQRMRLKAIELVAQERVYLGTLYALLLQYKMKRTVAREIKARIYLSKQRVLYWLAIATNARLVNELIPSLLKKPKTISYQVAQEKALELLDIDIKDKKLKAQIMDIFDPEKRIYEFSHEIEDQWIAKVIDASIGKGEKEGMELLSKVFELRQIELFKYLPGEILLAIAEETEEIVLQAGEVIFRENENANGLYCICRGRVKIVRQDKVMNILEAHSYFGELALIDEEPRSATAIAEEECRFLLLDKSTFDRLTEDVPEIYRSITRVIVRYLRQNYSLSS